MVASGITTVAVVVVVVVAIVVLVAATEAIVAVGVGGVIRTGAAVEADVGEAAAAPEEGDEDMLAWWRAACRARLLFV